MTGYAGNIYIHTIISYVCIRELCRTKNNDPFYALGVPALATDKSESPILLVAHI